MAIVFPSATRRGMGHVGHAVDGAVAAALDAARSALMDAIDVPVAVAAVGPTPEAVRG
ncbi:hypothetical protein AB0A95_18630 [Micromonospora sp. NPDC049230]|uniref:hypothetical protein n=1 Tax=Micromonospora sp. NPDC049230 TaxID=3155502 RepID=UPI0033DE5002